MKTVSSFFKKKKDFQISKDIDETFYALFFFFGLIWYFNI